jgi:hypothetical protein
MFGEARDDKNQVLKIEVSTDNGITWNFANGTASWSYTIDSLSAWGVINDTRTVMVRATDTDYKKNQSSISKVFTIDNTNPSLIGSITDINDTLDYNGAAGQDGYHQSGEGQIIRYRWKYEPGVAGYKVVLYQLEPTVVSDVFVKDWPASDGAYTYTSAEINSGAALNSGITNISFIRDSAGADSFGNFQFTGQDGGRYYIAVTPYDSMNNPGPSKLSVEEIVDTIAPPNVSSAAFSVNGSTSAPIYLSTRSVTFNWAAVTDTHTAIRYYKLNTGTTTLTIPGDITTYTYTYTTADAPSGAATAFTAETTAVDMAGNESAIPASRSFTIDLQSVADTGVVSDNSGDQYYNAAEAASQLSFSWADNVNHAGFDIQIVRTNGDVLKSYTGIAKPASGSTNTLGSDLAGTGVQNVELYFDGASLFLRFDAGNAEVNGNTYQVQVRAHNNAGTRSAWRTSNSVMIDRTAPGNPAFSIQTYDSIADAAVFAWNSTETMSGINNYDISVRINGAGWTSLGTQGEASYTYDTSVLPGGTTVELRVRARDKAGNTSANSVSGVVTKP